MVHALSLRTRRRGLHEITPQIIRAVSASSQALSPDGSGLCTVFVRHTSASIIIQENADPSARADLEAWMNRLVAENDPAFTHTAEGSDDMPSHIKAALTATSVGIPVVGGRLALGTWQGVYLWEHRTDGRDREVVVHVGP